MKSVLRFHVKEGEYRQAAFGSLLFHLLLLLFFTFGVSLLPAPPPLELGLGEGGGQGDFVTVGLAADTGGGAGMYKPPVTSRADSAPPPPPPKPDPAVEESTMAPEVFTEVKKPKPKPKPPPPTRRRPDQTPQKDDSDRTGLIPRESDPGKGDTGGSSGSGGGFGSGRGVAIGSGTGEGNIDSWYIRQVEQRVGKNWLQTSLGDLQSRVRAVATFSVRADGTIEGIEIEQQSGVSSVDLAVMRAIQASNPLPPLPLELRHRPVVFRAVFEYPPR